MNKDEAISFLRKSGYNVENERGVICVLYDKPVSMSEYKNILKLLRENGYDASFGMKPAVAGAYSERSNVKVDTEVELSNESTNELEDFDADELDEELDSDIQLSLFESSSGQLSFL